MELTKHHGLANDFLVVLDEANGQLPPIDGELARRLCDRRRGVGADGLIHGARPGPGSDVDVAMHLFNADGSRAEMSGNGIRCLAQALAMAREDHSLHLTIGTDVGDRTAVVSGGPGFQVVEVSVDMGPASEGPPLPPETLERAPLRVASVSMGNPHLVVEVEDVAGVDVAVEGPAYAAPFAGGINVELVALAGAPDVVDLVVWERGVGVTEACGTGACAAAHAAREWGAVGDRVEVRMPGGEAEVALDGTITLIGPASHIATVEWAGA